MRSAKSFLLAIAIASFSPMLLTISCAAAADAAPKTDKAGVLPHLTFDVKKKQVRVECEALAVEAPLEFFCCRNNTNEHEAVVRSPVLPSDLHTALLACGLQPG